MKEHGNKEHIERKLNRGRGASEQARAYMQAEASKFDWWARCWSCGGVNNGKPHELTTCIHCGVNLRKRNG
jgi:hypothetical protein